MSKGKKKRPVAFVFVFLECFMSCLFFLVVVGEWGNDRGMFMRTFFV